MLKDISKKLTMKKSFFVTQLEGFFNAISQEYQELIHQKEVENSLLEERVEKLENDIQNLVAIREELTRQLAEKDAYIDRLEHDSESASGEDAHYKRLLEENRKLRARLQQPDEEVANLKAEIDRLRLIIARGSSGYQSTLSDQHKEAIIEEISRSLKGK